MAVVIVSGSNRANSNSGKVSRIVADLATDQNLDILDVIDLEKVDLPIWNETAWQAGGLCAVAFEPFAKKLQAADGYIFVVPEWNGAKPAALANFCQYCSSKLMGHKPVLLVAVSTGVSGSYVIADMHNTFYKNTCIVYTPNHVILRFVETFLAEWDDPQGKDENVPILLDRLKQALVSLGVYAKNFGPIRQSLQPQIEQYPFGM